MVEKMTGNEKGRKKYSKKYECNDPNSFDVYLSHISDKTMMTSLQAAVETH